MVKKSTFRLFCLIVGFSGFLLISVKKPSIMVSTIGVVLCALIIGFGYAVTGKWGKYLIGEQMDGERPHGSLG